MVGTVGYKRAGVVAGLTLMAAAGLGTGSAKAVTLNGIKGQGLQTIYGSYAPGGNCATEPRIMIDDNGFAFRAAGQTRLTRKIEYAVSYMGQSYDGISLFFFPFPITDDDLGPLLMTVNAGEKKGVLTVESNLGPRQRLDPFFNNFTKSALQKCKNGAVAMPATPATRTPGKMTPPASTSGTGTGPMAGTRSATAWELRPVQGRPPIAYVEAAGSPHIQSLSLFCDPKGMPVLAMLSSKPLSGNVMLGWSFSGGGVMLNMMRSNQASTFWQASLARSPLPQLLLRQTGAGQLKINGLAEGQASLNGAAPVVKAALNGCVKL